MLQAAPTLAQGRQGSGENARIIAGPLRLTPDISVTTGVDTNVYNEPREQARQDVVARVTPQVSTWLRIGRARLQGTTSLTSVYFRRSINQRSVFVQTQNRLDVDLNRFEPYASVTFGRTREPASLDIETRPLRIERRVESGTALRLSSATAITAGAYAVSSGFGQGESIQGVNLQESLNRNAVGATLGVRIAATPVTTLSVAGAIERERFAFSPDRDADSVRLVPVIELSPFALISGRAAVGIRRFVPFDANVPEFTGVIAALDLSYVLRGATRFSVRADRDLGFSYEPTLPYYLVNAFSVSLTQRITDTLDVAPSYGRQQLLYRRLHNSEGAAPIKNTGVTFGISISQRVQRRTRVAWNTEYSTRELTVGSQGYDGLRMNLTVNYGL